MSGLLVSVPSGARILLDTSALLAHLGASEQVGRVATELVESCLRTGRNDGVISTITVGELLVRPLRASPQHADTVLAFLWSLPDLLIRSADFLVAAEGARIRAAARVGVPDSLIIATGVLTRATLMATNDRVLASASRASVTGMGVLLLSELVS